MKFVKNGNWLTQVLITLFVFTMISSPVTNAKNRRQVLRLTPKDKAQIIESILRKELSKKDFAKLEKFVFLSNELFPSELIPAIYQDKIELIEQEVARKRAKEKEGVWVFSFHEFKVKGAKVIIEFGHTQAYEKSFNSEATTYEYKKVSGKWIGSATEGSRTVFDPE